VFIIIYVILLLQVSKRPLTHKVMTIVIPNAGLEMRPVQPNNLDAVLRIYQQCEDFLSLGPVAGASMEMVRKDLEISRDECGFSAASTARTER